MDGQFEPMRTLLAGVGVTLNTVSRGEHVPEIERYIRTLKERCRASFPNPPFKALPRRMTI